MPRVFNMNETPLRTSGLSFALIGTPNTGKTTFAASFPGRKVVFLFDKKTNCYAGTDSIVLQYEHSKEVGHTEWDTMMSHVRALKNREALIIDGNTVVPANAPIDCIIVDSITFLSEMGWAKITSTIPEIDDPKDAYAKIRYAKLGAIIREFITELRNLADASNAHVFLICHVKREKDKDGFLTGREFPDLTGKLSEIVPGGVDEVYYFDVKPLPNNERRFLCFTAKQGQMDGRSSINSLTRRVFPPIIENLYSAWSYWLNRWLTTGMAWDAKPADSAAATAQIVTDAKPTTATPQTKGAAK